MCPVCPVRPAKHWKYWIFCGTEDFCCPVPRRCDPARQNHTLSLAHGILGAGGNLTNTFQNLAKRKILWYDARKTTKYCVRGTR